MLAEDDPQIGATVAVIAAADADILALQEIDFDAEGRALAALADQLEDLGYPYAYRLTLRPNTGWPTGVDLDGDGQTSGRRDAQGYGAFNGQGGMAVLSRVPIAHATDFSAVLWRDVPGSAADGLVPPGALSTVRLHEVAFWAVEFDLPGGAFTLLTTHASAPVFDGPEDRNGWRNADQLRFLHMLLEGWRPDGIDLSLAPGRYAVAGTLNVDPDAGEGHRDVLRALLDHPALQDVSPDSARGLPTADWRDPEPGDLRVDYVLPAAGVGVLDAAVMWGSPDGPEAVASDHRLVWVDLRF